ncbi:hypothetical protein [Flavobacterium sp.]|uniref:hypothetical protein n=1 Tax=Flavobacterium sp. TaxID=239 RepID=UPI00261D3E6B|nr:hypothetical protein [Flavobacterium sp.]
MLEKVVLITKNSKHQLLNIEVKNHKYEIDLSWIEKSKETSFDIEFVFQKPIQHFRNHDYTWVDCKKDRIATEFSPKIIKLSNDILVQANVNLGIWEVKKKFPKSLFWKFNPENAYPIVNYIGDKNEKKVISTNVKIDFEIKLELLFPKQAMEISRSKIPFSAITCFTDHCDFDTLENLKTQREFFKKQQIKVTKGFFLNHYSKREDNASFERNSEEINKWREDGHELCYHSLSQSIKSKDESFNDFENFQPPYSDIPTWIDHGYQPYNLSLYNKNNKTETYFSDTMKEKGIQILWNYIDSGTSTNGVINQINPEHFTLKSFLKGIKDLKFVNRISLLIKNIIFHYYGDEKLIINYKSSANTFKSIVFKRQFKNIPILFTNFYSILIPLLKVFFKWNDESEKPYKYAKYTPLFFRYRIDKKEFFIFQTLEIIDFIKTLSKNNIDKLNSEKGIFIGHTYFSAPMTYHYGKMMSSDNAISSEVETNFAYLSSMIKENQIWNPTLNELILYLSNFYKVKFIIDDEADLKLNETFNLNVKNVDV